MARPGTWDFDTEGDFLVCDGIEEVTVRRMLANGTYGDPIEGVRAVRETPKRTSAGTLIEGVDLIWHVNPADLVEGEDETEVPQLVRGDEIEDEAGDRWTIAAADLAGVLDQWTVPTVKAAERTEAA